MAKTVDFSKRVVNGQDEAGYIPTPRQQLAHDARERNILFGGAVGGGKSVCLVNDALTTCIKWTGCRVGIFRYELANFKRTTYNTLDEWVLSVENLVQKHNQQDHWIELCNGSRIVYGGLKPAESAAGDPFAVVKSLELARLYLDEVTDIPEKLYDFACTRINRVKGTNIYTNKLEFPKPRVLCSSNPSMGWVKTRWIDQKNRPGYRFIPSKVSDNPHLDASYEADLRTQWKDSPEMIEQLLEGDWDAVVDFEAIFPSNKLTEAMEVVDVPATEPVEFGVDVGAFGDDASVVVMRQGMKAKILLVRKGQATTDTTRQVIMLADEYHPQLIRVDTIGVGRGVYDQLFEQGHPVEEFIGGATPFDKRFRNRRAEAYWGLRNLIMAGKVSLPTSAESEYANMMMNEMGTIKYLQTESDRVIQIESKKAIKKRTGRSPNFADAMVYAFASEGFDWVTAATLG